MTVERPCPDSAHGAPSRVGSRRFQCRTCNLFSRRVERLVMSKLRLDISPENLRRLTEEAETELYLDLTKEKP